MPQCISTMFIAENPSNGLQTFYSENFKYLLVQIGTKFGCRFGIGIDI